MAGSRPAGPRLGGEQPDDPELHRDHRLHVDRAAAVDVAVGDVGRERIVAPALGRGRDDVEVRQQQERVAAGAVAAQPGVDGAASGDRLDDLGLEAGRGQDRGDPARRDELAVGRVGRRRVDRRDPDEVAQGLDELVDGPGPARLDGPRRRRGAHRHGTVPTAMTIAIPMTNPPKIRASDHREQQLAVAALLAQAGRRVGIAATRDVGRLEALGPRDPGAR